MTVFKQLSLAKDEIQDSLKAMLERDGKIEESLIKGQQLQVQSHTFKSSAKKVESQMKWRSRCYMIVVSLLVVVGLVLLVVWLVKLFKKDD